MNQEKLYNQPLKLKKNRVWRPFVGGKRLDKWQGVENPKNSNYGEEWVASDVEARNPDFVKNEGLSKVDSEVAPLLAELIKENPAKFLGEKHVKKFGMTMAILVKLLDSYSRLLIQVHPDDKFAREMFDSEFGKTEVWYILEGKYVYAGFKPEVTREKWLELFEKQDIQGMLDSLHKFKVSKGDLILIEGGMPHAIGEGCFLIEVQQPTDYTIRVEKEKEDGSKLPDHMLHQGLGYEKMFHCFHYDGMDKEDLAQKIIVKPQIIEDGEGGTSLSLIKNPFFSIKQYNINNTMDVSKNDIFSVSIVIKGKGAIIYGSNSIPIKQGDTLFIPAGVKNYTYKSYGDLMEVVESYPPK